MTLRIEVPGTHNIEGVFLLGPDELREVDAILARATRELRKHASNQLGAAVEDEIARRKTSGGVTGQDLESRRDQIRKDLKERYPFSTKKHVVAIRCRSGKTIKGESFEGIICSPGIQSELPEKATVEIQIADSRLSVELFGGSPPGIEVSVTPSDRPFAHRILQMVADWAEPKRKHATWCKYSSQLCLAGFFLLLAVFPTLLPLGLIQTSTGRMTLVQRASDLSAHGIDGNNQAQAVDILLRLTTQNYEGSRVVGIRGWYVALLIIAIGAIVLGWLCPRSTLGIGLGSRALARYRRVSKVAKVLVGTWLVAIAASSLGSWLYELMKSTTSP